MTLSPLGDSAVAMTLGDTADEMMVARVGALAAAVAQRRLRGVFDVVPAFAMVTVFYDAVRAGGFDRLSAELETLAARLDDTGVAAAAGHVEVPVCYGGELGPDLADLATQHALTPAEAVALHAGASYFVQAIGFVPGFAYLGGLPAELATPRRRTPRREVPAGSVGIGGGQTAVYPLATPGGWNLIGRTPARMFDPGRPEPSLLKAGDRVRFLPISEAEYHTATTGGAGSVGAPVTGGRPGGVPAGIEVMAPGMFTTVQDLGRTGHRAEGVALSGAADTFALRVANLLVGNPENTAGLEVTLVGPELYFPRDALVALGGADFPGLPRWQPMRIRAGSRLKLGDARRGCRGYLAVAGGIDVAEVLGSRSTQVRARLGGLEGRPLRAGDVLPVRDAPRTLANHWRIDERILPRYSNEPVVRVVRGAQAEEFGGEFFSTRFVVTPHSDRMGMRLRGPVLERRGATELRSAPVVPGTIQVPPDGQPIVLLADAQTLGGYPQIAHVIGVDLPLVAQLRPGATIGFREVALAEARTLACAREHALAMLREGLAQKLT